MREPSLSSFGWKEAITIIKSISLTGNSLVLKGGQPLGRQDISPLCIEKMTYEDFIDKASPNAWLMVAENLHEQALFLYNNKSDMIRHIDYRSGAKTYRYTVNRSVYLLGGFALENALKAFLVYENPSWISNGRMSKKLKTHSLIELKKECINVPYKLKYNWVLSAFEEGLESWARYPCSLSVEDTFDEGVLNGDLLRKYNLLMTAYIKRLKSLLLKKWHGPHGYVSSWQFIKY